MDNVNRNLAFLGGLLRGSVPALSPTTDDFELMHYLRQPLSLAANEFRILFNVALLEPHEIEVCVLEGNKIEIRVKHPRKQNLEGLWMTRDAVYTYNLPQESCNKVLQAQWFADNFLLIKTNSSEVGEKEFADRVRLVIERVAIKLKPNIEMSVLKEFVEDVRNRAQDTLHYLRYAVHNMPSSAEKKIYDIMNKQSGKIVSGDSGVQSRVESPVGQTSEACSSDDKE